MDCLGMEAESLRLKLAVISVIRVLQFNKTASPLVKLDVKQSHYRPEQVPRVPGV
jgi:hypothetical protein